MTVDSRVFTAREEIIFTATEEGTAVRYIANFNFPLPLAAANRVYPAAMDKVGKSTMEGLKAALEDAFEAPAESRRLALADKLILPGLWRFTDLGTGSRASTGNRCRPTSQTGTPLSPAPPPGSVARRLPHLLSWVRASPLWRETAPRPRQRLARSASRRATRR